MRILAAIPFIALAVSVSGHAIFQEVYVNGVSQGHTTGIRVPNYNGVCAIYLLTCLFFTHSRALTPPVVYDFPAY